MIEEQIALEREMLDAGVSRFLRLSQEAKSKGEATRMGGFRHILKASIEPLAKRIEQELSASFGDTKAHVVRGLLSLLEPRVTAYLTAKAIIDHVASRVSGATLARVASKVGTALELEARLRLFAQERPEDFKWLTRDLAERRQTTQHRLKVMTLAMNRHGITLTGWANEDRVRLGLKLTNWFAELSKLVDVRLVRTQADKTKYVVVLRPEAVDDADKVSELMALNHPSALPCVVPPRDWTSPTDGGYHMEEMRRRYPLVKHPKARPPKAHKAYLSELAERPEQLAPVYHALNAMQRTAWAINKHVLDVMQTFWRSGTVIGGLPSIEPEAIPPKPLDIDTNEDARKIWRRRAAMAHIRNHESRSKRVHAKQMLDTADRFKDAAAIYFPYNLDFRGRSYAVPFFNPQGPDIVRGLLHFSEAKEIKDGVAAGWLAVHGANLFGEADKRSLEDRIQWVEDRNDRIEACARDPYENRWWSEADEPWQFLAWCFEWADFLDSSRTGRSFTSRCVVALDGTCSGLQHFSAILRDARGGAAVNLTPSPKPRDIYADVARVVEKRLHDDLRNGTDTQAKLADGWLQSGLVNRKLTKRPVMIVPYSGTLSACRKYILEYLDASGSPFEDDWPYVKYMSEIVWDAIQEVVVSAKRAMRWLRKIAKAATEAKVPISWTTPVGFPVVQYYPKLAQYRIRMKIGGSPVVKSESIRLTLLRGTGEIDLLEQKLGISPNFIHSMDAAAMVAYLNYATENGLDAFAMIHDSFGTHAADAQVSAICLRQAFVDMYETNDVLEQFRQDVAASLPPALAETLPSPPRKGSLDLKGIMKSDYFFA